MTMPVASKPIVYRPRALPLLGPGITCAVLATLGTALLLTWPGLEWQTRLVAVVGGWISVVIALLCLLPFAWPVADPLSAAQRYALGFAVRFLLTLLAGAILTGYIGWPLLAVIATLGGWYVVLLLLGEVWFVARFVQAFDLPEHQVREPIQE